MDNPILIILTASLMSFIIVRKIINAKNLMSYKELSEIISSKKKYLLLDVRTRSEFKTGYITTSKNISNEKLPKALKKTKKESLVILYCQSGARANVAKRKLESFGYSNVKSFGGISRWKGSLES